MKITSVTVHNIEKENSRMKGIAVATLDDCFVVKGIRIIDGDNGLFIAMPSKTTATGEHSDIAHPINKETRKMFEDAIFGAYEEMKKTGEELVKIEL